MKPKKIKIMNSFKNAETFFHNCESGMGFEACQDYVVENASFNCQSEALAAITTLKDYVNWISGLGTPMPGNSYKISSSAYDADNNTAIFFSTFTGTHSADGGPVPPTNKTTNTHYVYAIQMNGEGKVASMTKIWNGPWALKELGWM